ncbi:hypothetical protein FDZ58_04050 [Ehrlichia ruminantium]|uniref:Uncharacterized protein n=1 Tax=Ehrlichia ruminantium (strain Welgevonden) TaxID=254945 RepID=A0A0H3M921_EHRRW|nr:hypothetical protein [Ehrlichia ruminantium]KYW99827.1 hypothetical protein AUR40_04575 [Ehrlichia ruminantium]QLK50804.1 hypothetical protein FDZ68_04045 [Ehrlichia ruminantium]QLK51726.1 hypothetical protein FDZ66_04045 [Ehrlichia ruminantium]QLK53564.1 hypothetical protein FDZ64_04045 [Ehrlichia ruminantium]QLK55403.1 hypothetical protein FDZ62_04055 [Ehrlichia ruminantium]
MGDIDIVHNVSEFLYAFFLRQLNLATLRLYDTHCISIEGVQEVYAPFSCKEGALIKLASCACDILNQPEMVGDVNVRSNLVEDISVNISRITTTYCKMLDKMMHHPFSRREILPRYIGLFVEMESKYSEILSMVKNRCFFDGMEGLPRYVESSLFRIKKLFDRIRKDCATLIRYSNFFSQGFTQLILAVHNINFFVDEMEKLLLEDIISKCEDPKMLELARVGHRCGVIGDQNLKDYFSIREPGFCESDYAISFKEIALSSIAKLYKASFDKIKETCGVTLQDMVNCVMQYDRLHNNQGKSFPNGVELLVSSNGQIKLLNGRAKVTFLSVGNTSDDGAGPSSRSVVSATFEVIKNPSIGI